MNDLLKLAEESGRSGIGYIEFLASVDFSGIHLNAQNWVYLMDTLYYKWSCGSKQELPVEVRDLKLLSVAPPELYGEIKVILDRQQWQADQMVVALKKSGLSPSEVIDLSLGIAKSIAQKEAGYIAASANNSPLSIPMALSNLMLAFYKPADLRSNTNLCRPLIIARDTILASPESETLELQHLILGAISAFMDKVARGEAKGMAARPDWVQGASEFAYFFAHHVFADRLGSDRAQLTGKYWEMIVDSVVALTRLQLNREKGEE